MEYTKDTVIGCAKDGFSITGGDLHPSVLNKLNAYSDLYEALLSALGVMATLDQSKGWVQEISTVIKKALTKAKKD